MFNYHRRRIIAAPINVWIVIEFIELNLGVVIICAREQREQRPLIRDACFQINSVVTSRPRPSSTWQRGVFRPRPKKMFFWPPR